MKSGIAQLENNAAVKEFEEYHLFDEDLEEMLATAPVREAKKIESNVSRQTPVIPAKPKLESKASLGGMFRGTIRSLQEIVLENLLSLVKADGGNLRILLKTIETQTQPGAERAVWQNILDSKLFECLAKAVIDNDKATVRAILEFQPELLLRDPVEFGYVEQVESQMTTLQRLCTEKVFIMAQKLERPEIVEIMLEYFPKLEKMKPGEIKMGDKKDDKTEAEKQWVVKQLDEKAQQERDQTLQNTYIHGCNLILMNANDEKEILEDKLLEAKRNRTPILIKKQQRYSSIYSVYGDVKGDGTWTFTQIGPNQHLDKLSFDKGRIQRRHELFTSQLVEILSQGHVYLKLMFDHDRIRLAELIKIITKDTEAKVEWESEGQFWTRANVQKSARTEKALKAFRDTVLPERACTIDGDLDVKQLLIAAYKAIRTYWNEFKAENLWDQRELYQLGVIGYIIPVCSPRLGASYCRGMDNQQPAVGVESKAGDEILTLKNGRRFHRENRNAKTGQGFDLCCGITGHAAMDGRVRNSMSGDGPTEPMAVAILEEYVKQERRMMAELRNRCKVNQGLQLRS